MITTILLIVIIVLITINIWLSTTKKTPDYSEDLKNRLIKIDSDLSKIDPLLRDEFSRSRDESQKSFKDIREELSNSFKILGDTLTKTVADLSFAQKNQFETFSKQLNDFVKDFFKKNKVGKHINAHWISSIYQLYNSFVDKSGTSSYAHHGRNTVVVFVFFGICWFCKSYSLEI